MILNFLDALARLDHLTHPNLADTVRSPPHIYQIIDFPSETLRDRTPANQLDPALLDRAIEPK
jgi:hypothetical protein